MDKLYFRVSNPKMRVLTINRLIELGYTWASGTPLKTSDSCEWLYIDKIIKIVTKSYGYNVNSNAENLGYTCGDLEEHLGLPNIICDYCGSVIDQDFNDLEFFDNGFVCPDCLSEQFFYCEDCGELSSNDDLIYIKSESKYICQDCYDQNYFTCHECGEVHSNSEKYVAHYRNYCESCFDELYIYCEDCGEAVPIDEVIERDGCYYCSDCCSNFVLGYHDFDDWQFKRLGEEPRIYFGIEIETNNSGAIANLPNYWDVFDQDSVCVFESDGSISGVEAITHPMTIEYYRKHKLNGLLSALDKAGFVTSNGTGIHVHISKKAFTKLGLLKLIYIFNKFEKDICDFAERNNNRYCQVNKSLVDGNKTIRDKICNQSEERYQVVNLENDATVEIRIFKSTFNQTKLDQIMEFCHNLIDVCKLPVTQIAKMSFNQILGVR
jgi:hypothetical protein